MHRHGYKGRKLGREKDQRLALMRSLSVALVEHGSIETTLPKAKELRPRFEKLVSKAKIGDLHNRRQLVSALNSVTAAHKMVDQIAPAMQRTSGYLRIEKTRFRRGDNAPMARISFVDDINGTATEQTEQTAAVTQKAAPVKKVATTSTTAKKPAAKAAPKKAAAKPAAKTTKGAK